MKIFQRICVFLIALSFVSYAAMLLHYTDFTLQDIGRHIINGREVLQGNTQVIFSNVYSYAEPNHGFVNHHWLSGIVFYLLYEVGGMTSLYILFVACSLVTLAVFFMLLKRMSNTQVAAILLPFSVLFLVSRVEIRPEMFSYLFLVIFLFLLHKMWREKTIRWRDIGILMGIEVLWINLHIFFFLGICVVGTYLLFAVLEYKTQRVFLKKIGILLFSLLLVLPFNPHGFTGALYPIHAFRDYGYAIVENMNLWFLHDKISSPSIPLYVIAVCIFLACFIYRRKDVLTVPGFFAVVGLGLGYAALRNIPLFVFFSFPFLATSLCFFWKSMKRSRYRDSLQAMGLSVLVMYIIMFPLLLFSGTVFPEYSYKEIAPNVVPGQFASVEFYKKIHVSGNMFNNYDIGSYLIFALYPNQKVFVDNRPEAFGKAFFDDVYVPMQMSETVWQEKLDDYDFQTIFWGHRDITPWSYTFLRSRLKDPAWVAVYADAYAIIFVRNTEENTLVIEEYGLSSEELKLHLSPLFHDVFSK